MDKRIIRESGLRKKKVDALIKKGKICPECGDFQTKYKTKKIRFFKTNYFKKIFNFRCKCGTVYTYKTRWFKDTYN